MITTKDKECIEEVISNSESLLVVGANYKEDERTMETLLFQVGSPAEIRISLTRQMMRSDRIKDIIIGAADDYKKRQQ